jgi:hypothetical protein
MELTFEVRWFLDGTPPDDVTTWFEAFEAAQEAPRTDLYLASDDPGLNAKLREGKVQLKRRGGQPEAVTFAPGVAGAVERWHKWSFPLKRKAPDLFAGEPTGLWHAVEKHRTQRFFAPDAQADLLHAAGFDVQTNAPADAYVELTRVRLYRLGADESAQEATNGTPVQQAWSVCLEAEGPGGALLPTFRQMGAYVFGTGTPPTLRPEASMGYAAWLARQTAPAERA